MSASNFQQYLEALAAEHKGYTVSQAAEKLGCSVDTLTRYRKRGITNAPSLATQIGQTPVNIYTEADIRALRRHMAKKKAS